VKIARVSAEGFPMSKDRKSLGARLREGREYLGLSQEEVAKAVNLPRSAISLIESGQRKIDALELKKFAELYQRPVGEFTGEVEATAPPQASVQYLARAAAKLNESDQAELLRFAEFLSSRAPVRRES
jgi:transcriptional regulator with XRE-family HTH domain